jgi:uncharacterized protein YndB with AHSA1/START domain
MATKKETAEIAASPLIVEREYNASPEQIWDALTDSKKISKWYGMDFPEFKPEVGFEFQFVAPMKSYVHKCRVMDVVPFRKLAYTWRYDGYPGDSLVTFELFPQGNSTKVRVTHEGLESFAQANNPDFDKKNFTEGWNAIIGTTLKEIAEADDTSDREIVITRLINAPRELVFDAFTDPAHLEKWWGPKGFSTTTKEFDFRPGGKWIHTMHGPDGTDYPNECYYEKIVKPELIEYEHGGGDDVGVNDAAFHATILFADEGGKTRLTMKSLFLTKKQRDHVVEKYGAIEGGNQTLARLEEYVNQL